MCVCECVCVCVCVCVSLSLSLSLSRSVVVYLFLCLNRVLCVYVHLVLKTMLGENAQILNGLDTSRDDIHELANARTINGV